MQTPIIILANFTGISIVVSYLNNGITTSVDLQNGQSLTFNTSILLKAVFPGEITFPNRQFAIYYPTNNQNIKLNIPTILLPGNNYAIR